MLHDKGFPTSMVSTLKLSKIVVDIMKDPHSLPETHGKLIVIIDGKKFVSTTDGYFKG